MTASPEPIPKAAKAMCRAAVPELTARACGDPTKAANSCSNCFVFGPVVIHPPRRVFSTSFKDGLQDTSRPVRKLGG